MLKKIFLGLAAVLVIIQFIRPEKNDSNDQQAHVSTKYDVPAEVATILKGACDDCHSNKTEYPWYANVQPVAWWLAGHVEDGKRHLNFSTFTTRKIAVQNHKFEEVVEMVEQKEMPLSSYTWMGLHPEANLTDAQRQVLVNWAKAQMDTLKANYPADSLILRRPSGPQPGKY
ncbi:MAG: heme-binding domain-containing protein [Saprospiraceae bacterium]|nr:heme-binding domain-containing protein [Saprospiraceae bacterium]